MIKGGKYTNLTEKQALYIWDNVREYDRLEFEGFGVNRTNLWQVMQQGEDLQCLEVDGVPVYAFGYYILGNTVGFNFYGTDEVKKYWLFITKGARSYVKHTMNKHFPKRGIIYVWEGHTESRRWLPLLGFNEKGSYIRTKAGKYISTEFNKYEHNRRNRKCA